MWASLFPFVRNMVGLKHRSLEEVLRKLLKALAHFGEASTTKDTKVHEGKR
jgi:hypothetical protein